MTDKIKCYIYTRVSTSMQVDGYSLEAQNKKLTDYANYQGWIVAGEYSDESHSGKNIAGRPEFMRMLKDIENNKDGVSYVLVFKLSRFGRNAADVLSSLQLMQDFGVNLICVDDGIDSSKDSGKLMISVLSAVAEIERENILIQTMEGRKQKAREGRWNGGFAPYGYELVNGELHIVEDEAVVIREIFDKFIHTNMGINAICTHLTNQGFTKKMRQNNTLPNFSAHFVKGVLDNPVYCGKIAFGRRKTEKIPGKRNEYHIVKQDDYEIYDGIHEAIVSEEDWNQAKQKRIATGFKPPKTHDLEHEHLLSAIIKCPICGAGMYGNVNRKKKADGEYYKEYYYYACKHRSMVTGHPCTYNKQWSEEKIDAAVVEIIKKLTANPKFEKAIREKIDASIDTSAFKTEIDNLRKQLKQINGAKNKLAQQMDILDITDPQYDRKYSDMQYRLNAFYDTIEDIESRISEVEFKIETIKSDKIKSDSIYKYLLHFDKFYDEMTDKEKKIFMNSFLKSVEIYEDERCDGRILKSLGFRFPIFSEDGEIVGASWDNESSVEQVKSKIELNKVTHSVRAAQAVLQYGVGAMVDFPDQTLVTAAPEYWSGASRIYDDRFAKALGVDYFALPTNIAYTRFPEWYFCPKCRSFQPLKQWLSEYKKTQNKKTLELDPYMIEHMQCPKCKQDLVVARIVTVCQHGHLNDFPWIKWVHAKSRKDICSYPKLQFKTGASGTEGLEGLSISCSCGAFATLKGAFDKDCFEKVEKESGKLSFLCDGNHPFRHSKETCTCYPKTVQRGASSVYFPVVHSSLVIPPYANKLNARIEQSHSFDDCTTIIADEDPADKLETIKKRLSKWAEKIALEIGASKDEVEKILSHKWLEGNCDTSDVTSVQYRLEEYAALTGEIGADADSMLGDFSREEMDITEYGLSHIKAISLIDKVRVVNALIGFSRIQPAMSATDDGFVEVKEPTTNWYPAYEVRGEGIFIEFNQDEIETWINDNPQVSERAKLLNDNYASSFIGRNHPREITPKFIMLHTLSHLLISQLSFECGYSIASLSERLYCSEESDGKRMAGIFIYTASGDSEGTLGGLVRQGRPDAFPNILKKAVAKAKTCSNDPVCIMSRGQGRESLNLAACHACGLLPETCCEEKNAFLDRGLIVGTFDNPEIGYWKRITD